jgi:hypothetical protein
MGPGQQASLNPQHAAPGDMDWFEWIVGQAAGTQDARLAVPLHDLYVQYAPVKGANTAPAFVLRALAACGSVTATEALVGQIDDDEARVLAEGGAPMVEGMTSLSSLDLALYFSSMKGKSLRVQILQRHWWRYELYPMPSEVSDSVFRSALSAQEVSAWYTLYLLAGIKEPQAGDRDRLMQIWDKGDTSVRVVAVDVLYAWSDWPTLLDLHEETESDEVRSEIAWALAGLGVAQAVRIVEDRVVRSWNKDWLNSGRPFMMWTSWSDNGLDDPKCADAMRKAEAIQVYFHPEWEDLDKERLAALQRLGDNSEIHPGLRFNLFVADYATKDWAKPLFRKAVRDVLETYPSSSTVATILFNVDVRFVVDACAEFGSDTPRQSLLTNLLATGSGAFLPTIKGLLWQVWPQRYTETQGQSMLFREPGDLAASLDYYCQHAKPAGRIPVGQTPKVMEPVLQSIVKDDSLPAGYRAFLLVYWPTAPGFFPKEFVENLLKEDMPDFIREALQQRLLDWGVAQ